MKHTDTIEDVVYEAIKIAIAGAKAGGRWDKISMIAIANARTLAREGEAGSLANCLEAAGRTERFMDAAASASAGTLRRGHQALLMAHQSREAAGKALNDPAPKAAEDPCPLTKAERVAVRVKAVQFFEDCLKTAIAESGGSFESALEIRAYKAAVLAIKPIGDGQ